MTAPAPPHPEFSRPERIDAIGASARQVTIEADAQERAALAARFGLIGVERLGAALSVRREAAGIIVTGRVGAVVIQRCVATGDPLTAQIDEAVALRFVEETDVASGDEVELVDDALDTIGYSGGAIDLGEAAAQTMALALDPFPRGPGADAALRAAGVTDEDGAGPFGALAALRDRLKG